MAQILAGVVIPRDKDGNFLAAQTQRIYRDCPESDYPFDEFAEYILKQIRKGDDAHREGRADASFDSCYEEFEQYSKTVRAGRARIKREKRAFAESQAKKEGASC